MAKIVRASDGTEVKPAEAEKAAKTVKKAAGETAEKARDTVPAKKSGGSALGLRIGAIALWLVAIGCEVMAIMAVMKNFTIRFTKVANTNTLLTIILFVVLDLIFAIIAAQLWKKANHIDPPSEKNKFVFYLVSELGVIMACICFIPLIIWLLKDKKLDKKTKTIAAIVAVVALLITGVASADFNPISAEEKAEAEQVFTESVYWSPFGHKYHLHTECGALSNSATLYEGSVTEGIESGRTSVCSFCKNWWDKQVEAGAEGFRAIEWDKLNVEPAGELIEDAGE